MRTLAFLSCMALAGCATEGAYGPSGDNRLESATSGKGETSDTDKKTLEIAEKGCGDVAQKVQLARNDERPEADRLKGYADLYADLKNRVTTMDDGLTKNPDLKYKEGAQKVQDALEQCNQIYADVKNEFERFLREICELPVVQEVRGGAKVNVARMDFQVVRDAIEVLNPDDKDTLIAKIEAAEKKVGVTSKSHHK
jgi:hypothetical protein